MSRDRGVAILLVVVLTLAVTVVVTATRSRSTLEMRRTTNLVFLDQALAYHLGAEDWAAHMLRRDAEQDTVDDLTEEWNQRGLEVPIEGVRLVGTLEDLDGRFNVNNLLKTDGSIDEAQFAQLKRLLDAVGVAETDQVAAAIADWIDADQDPRAPLGAEDSSYLRLEPPYRTSDAPLLWIGELRAVEGIDADTFARIAPQLAALPAPSAINVNTATLPVLQSLSDAARGDPLAAVVARQRNAPFGSVAEFSADYGRAVPNGMRLSVESHHFALRTTVVIEGVTSTMYSLLARASGGATHPLRRSTDLDQ